MKRCPAGNSANACHRKVKQLCRPGLLGTGAQLADRYGQGHVVVRAELRARSVEFLEEPTERPYGIDAAFRDPSGHVFRLTETRDYPG